MGLLCDSPVIFGGNIAMEKKQWAKSSNGPDETDMETMMRALSALHSGHVAIIISPAGLGFNGGVDIAASMIFDVLPGSSIPTAVAANVSWPNNTSKTIWGAAYCALHALDVEIGKVYKNESLWK